MFYCVRRHVFCLKTTQFWLTYHFILISCLQDVLLFQMAGPATHRLHPDHHPTYHHPTPTPHSVRTNPHPHPSIVVTRDYLPSPAYSSHPNHPQQPSTTMSRVISNNEQQVWPQIQFLSLLNSGDDDSITEYK